MAIDIRATGDFCVRAANPEKGEGEGTQYEIIGTNRGYTVPKGTSDIEAAKLEKQFFKALSA